MFRLLLLLPLLTVSGAGLRAHHSIAGVYDGNQPVTLDGVVVEFAFVNPHPFVVVEVADGAEPPQSWRLELDNRFELVDVGMRGDTLKRGDRVTVTGSRARDGSRSLYVRRLERPVDGFRYEQVGASPRIRRP